MRDSCEADGEQILPIPNRSARIWLRRPSAEWREKNLGCYDAQGLQLWAAEEPHPLDKWVGVTLNDDRLFATSYGGIRCEIDLATGRILSREFVK